MLDFVTRLLLGVLVFLDIVLHIFLDIKKGNTISKKPVKDSKTTIPTLVFLAVFASTVLTFILIFMILFSGSPLLLQFLIPLFDPPAIVRMSGLLLLSLGIILHGWSRFTRKNMATF
jgi:hypothetical protein